MNKSALNMAAASSAGILVSTSAIARIGRTASPVCSFPRSHVPPQRRFATLKQLEMADCDVGVLEAQTCVSVLYCTHLNQSIGHDHIEKNKLLVRPLC